MSSNRSSKAGAASAEQAFRDAFERLKRGRPERLPKGTPVSQNNVAKEAGVDPSALRKGRYPTLIAEIQSYLQANPVETPPSARQARLAQRKRNRNLQQRIEATAAEQDAMRGLLADAFATILRQAARIEEIEATLPPEAPSNVTPLSRSKTRT